MHKRRRITHMDLNEQAIWLCGPPEDESDRSALWKRVEAKFKAESDLENASDKEIVKCQK